MGASDRANANGEVDANAVYLLRHWQTVWTKMGVFTQAEITGTTPCAVPGQPEKREYLVRDVWLCAGQSSMEFRCSQEATWKTETESAALPQVRLRNMGYAGQGIGATGYSAAVVTRQTAADFYSPSVWSPCAASSAAGFSAVGYFFA